MTCRPGQVKIDVPVTLERPRRFELIATPEFADYKAQLLASVREESLKMLKGAAVGVT
jgi:hypothetical protein